MHGRLEQERQLRRHASPSPRPFPRAVTTKARRLSQRCPSGIPPPAAESKTGGQRRRHTVAQPRDGSPANVRAASQGASLRSGQYTPVAACARRAFSSSHRHVRPRACGSGPPRIAGGPLLQRSPVERPVKHERRDLGPAPGGPQPWPMADRLGTGDRRLGEPPPNRT